MRLLISGSRGWAIDAPIRSLVARLDTFWDIVIHGGCPEGADAITRAACAASSCTAQVFEADWNRYGKAAGPIRNKQMARSGPTSAHFFWDGKSRGTRDCMRRVLEVGYIPMFLHTTLGKASARAELDRLERKYPRIGIGPIEITCYTA